jgi:acylphosphatase
MKALQVRITGLVQGVGYRAWAEQAARSRGLGGWVRNRRDGSVEALIAGPDDTVDEMLALFRQGPSAGRVNSVTSKPAVAPLEPGFRALPTA